MLQAVFAVLTAVGVWVAWRANPLYSTKWTLRFVGVVGLTTIAFVGAIVAIAELVQGRPVVVEAAALAAAVLAGTLALIWVIIAFTSPQVPPLPVGAKPVYVHRAEVRPWARRFVIALVAFGVAAFVLRGDAQLLVSSLGGLLAFLAIVMLFAGYVAAGRMDKRLATMEVAPWVYWQYTPAEWQSWTRAETDRMGEMPPQWIWRRDWKRLLWPMLAVALGVTVFDPGGSQWKAAYVVAVLLLWIVIIEASNRSAGSASRRLRALLSRTKPESYFGASGVFSDGIYTEWLTVSNYLLEATIDERAPRSVALRFEVIEANAVPSQSTRYVLIPAQSENDLARLQQLLSEACPSANVALTTGAPAATAAIVAS